MDGRHFIYGDSFATGRRCNLKSLTLSNSASHIFDVDMDTMDLTKVTGELLLHHHCELDSVVADKIDAYDDKIKFLEKEIHGVPKKMADLQAGIAKYGEQEFQDSSEALKDHLLKLRDRLDENERQKKRLQVQKRLAAGWHQPALPRHVTIALPLVASEHLIPQTEDLSTLLKSFMPNATDKKLSDAGVDLASLALRASETTFWYNGTSMEMPCAPGPVVWAVLAKPQPYPFADLRMMGSAAKGTRTSSAKPKEVQLLAVDSKVLLPPKWSATQTKERKVRYVPIICGWLFFGTCVHAFLADAKPKRDSETYFFFVMACWVVALFFYMFGFAFLPFGFSEEAGNFAFEPAAHSLQEAFHFRGVMPLLASLLWGLLAAGLMILGCFPIGALLFGFVFCVAVTPDCFGLSSLAAPGVVGAWMPLGKIPLFEWVGYQCLRLMPLTFCFWQIGLYWIPMFLSSVVAPWLVLPAGAFFNRRLNCVDGFDWEVHVSFAIVICLKSMVWLAFSSNSSSSSSYVDRVTGFVFYVLAELDMYTDAMFIAIATDCGSWYGGAALSLYVAGVIVMQILLPMVCLPVTGGGNHRARGLMATWQLLLFPMEAIPSTGKTCEVGRVPETIDEKDRKFQVLLSAVLRCVGEDLPQCVLQWLFTVHVKKNPLIIFSIGTSVASTVFSVGKASKAYFCD